MKAYYSNFLFDLYGTLVDISTDEQKPYLWQKMPRQLRSFGIECTRASFRESYRRYADAAAAQAAQERGRYAEPDFSVVFCQLLGEKAAPEAVAALARAFRMGSLKHLRLYPGARETLRTLRARGCGVYLISNAQALFTRPELDMLALANAFDGIALSSDYGYRKPSEQFYRAALERFGLSAVQCLMVGNDDIADCHGAAAVGLDSCYLSTAQSPVRERPLPPNSVQLRSIRAVTRFAPRRRQGHENHHSQPNAGRGRLGRGHCAERKGELNRGGEEGKALCESLSAVTGYGKDAQ